MTRYTVTVMRAQFDGGEWGARSIEDLIPMVKRKFEEKEGWHIVSIKAKESPLFTMLRDEANAPDKKLSEKLYD